MLMEFPSSFKKGPSTDWYNQIVQSVSDSKEKLIDLANYHFSILSNERCLSHMDDSSCSQLPVSQDASASAYLIQTLVCVC